MISRLVQEIAPDEVYNLAAMSQVQISFDMPEYTASTNGGGIVRIRVDADLAATPATS